MEAKPSRKRKSDLESKPKAAKKAKMGLLSSKSSKKTPVASNISTNRVTPSYTASSGAIPSFIHVNRSATSTSSLTPNTYSDHNSTKTKVMETSHHLGPSSARNVRDSPIKCEEVQIMASWDEVGLLSEVNSITRSTAQNFITLLKEGCTLPFIARYRKDKVKNLMPDRLQLMYESYQEIVTVKKKINTVLETLKKSKKLTPEVQKNIVNCRSLAEIDLIYAPLKTHTLSLAEKARKLGLEEPAKNLLSGNHVDLRSLCNQREDELSTDDKVEAHVTHIVADIICKDPRVLEHIRTLKEETNFSLQCSRTKSSIKEKEKEVPSNKKYDSKSDPETYKLYFDFKSPVQFVKPHQTLAINRGEDEKILSVKIIVPDWFMHKMERFCTPLWRGSRWVQKGVLDAYNRLIKPWLSRQVRSQLTLAAQKEAIKTFTTNLEKYLLTEPIKNRRIAGLDPGFRAGCKVGIIDSDGQQLEALAIHPDFRSNSNFDPAASQLKHLLNKHGVDIIGLGNGTACRETETWLKKHGIAQAVPVVIVPEQGASVYSVSKEAQKEHPDMDPNLISALSIARRVLDPLGELIKVEPKNLGVGLYQHDIPTKMLETALDCAVEKVVSLVGADINTASHALLRRIAGLTDSRAKAIINFRQANGGISSRAQILQVTGIGKITFQQCAGFLKVVGGSEPLDSTIIHPESYSIAKKFAKKLGLNLADLNRPQFPTQVEAKVSGIDLSVVCEQLNTDASTLELIVNALKQATNEDVIRFSKPVYSLDVQATGQLKTGLSLTGVVRNVVPFGCFVDCGLGHDGLIHSSKMGGNRTPRLGDRVAVTLLASPTPKKIQLQLNNILD